MKRSFPVTWESARPTAAPHDCFADEIAIDFPSADQFVERLRDGLVPDDEGDALTTEVALSWREARRGVVVPLDVPLRGTCRRCGGRGETWTEPCAACGGTGDAIVHHPVRLALPAGVEEGSRFRFRVRSPHAAPMRVEVRIRLDHTR